MDTNEIRKQVLIHAPIDRVWRAISNADEFGIWFGVRFDSSFEPGKAMTGACTPTRVDPEVAAKQKDFEGARFEITVEEMLFEKRFSFRWHPFAVDPNVDYSSEPMTLIVFELEDTDDGVQLTVTESGFNAIPEHRRAQAFQANEGGWSLVVTLVKRYSEEAA
jgi:uncharacterized protein YndB with AHSA1/START domain